LSSADPGRPPRGLAWLHPPVKSDPHEARTAATVHTLTLGFVGAAAVWAVAAAFVMPRPMLSLAVAATIVGFLLAAFVIAHVGNPQLAACVLVSGVWLGTTCAVAFVSGVAAVSISTYIIAILAAGLLIGANAAIVVAALSATASLGLAYLQTQGRLPEVVAPSPWGSVAIELTLFVAAAALLTDALGRLRGALDRAEQSEAQTRALIEQASDAIVVTDPDGWIVDANARAASLLGYDVEELLGLSPRDFLDGEELADSDQVRIGLQPGQRALVERTARRRDGSLVEVEGAVSRLEDGRIQVSMRDVGERRQAERMQERLRMALDAAGEAILLLDEEMGLLYANSAFRRMYGGTGPLEPGMHLEQITDLPHRRELLERALPDVSEGRPWAGRHERVLDDGTRAVRHATMAPVRDGAGGLVGYVAILRDITREVELEESLQLSQKLEAVGQLAGGLAHDFNNLLTVILGTAELLRDTAPSEDVDEIFEAGQRAAALTTKLLAFSRNQAVVRRRVDLNEVVREVSGMLRRLVRENVACEMRLSA